MIVKDDWKLFLSYDTASKVPPVLFNMNDDPHEMLNLIGKSNKNGAKYMAKAEGLKADLVEWLSERDSKYADSITNVKF